jgi:hypothetical protein
MEAQSEAVEYGKIHSHGRFSDLYEHTFDRKLYWSSAGTVENVVNASAGFGTPTLTVAGTLAGPAASGVQVGATTMFYTPIGKDLALDRCVMLRMQCQVLVEAPASSNADALSIQRLNGIALAQAPLHRCMNSMRVGINNQTLNSDPWVTSPIFHKCVDSIDHRKVESLYPIQPDSHNTIAAMTLAAGGRVLVDSANALTGATAATCGLPVTPIGAESPFGCDYSLGYDESRSRFRPIKVERNQRTGTSDALSEKYLITYEITEPLQSPFFDPLVNGDTVLGRVSSLNVQIVWNNLNGLFTIAPGLALAATADGTTNVFACTTTVLGFVGTPQLLFRTYVPTTQVPQVIRAPYNELQTHLTTISDAKLGTIGGSAPVASGSKTWQTVPSKIFIFARPQVATASKSSVDALLAITSLTFNLNKANGGFSQATPQQLHQMSVRNGLNQSYSQWRYKQGSVVIIDLEKGDIANYTPGVNTDFTFNVTVGLQNTQAVTSLCNRNGGFDDIFTVPNNTAATDQLWTLYIIGQMPGDMELSADSVRLSIGTSREEAEAIAQQQRDDGTAPDDLAPVGAGYHSHATRGGTWYGKIWKHIRKPVWAAYHRVAPTFNHAVNTALDLANKGIDKLHNMGNNALGAGVKAYGYPSQHHQHHQRSLKYL